MEAKASFARTELTFAVPTPVITQSKSPGRTPAGHVTVLEPAQGRNPEPKLGVRAFQQLLSPCVSM